MTGPLPTALADVLAGRFQLERELGRGGMATVYLARDLKHDRHVAIKVLRAELAQALGPERFLREIRISGRLQHPNIMPVYDSGAEGPLWYAMPYVDGETLRERLRREPQLPLDDALRIALEIAAALGYAHRHGIVHRDIKPENILVERDEPHAGRCVVADFGIARPLDDAAERLTESGLALGTPAYMSPEQAMADARLDARSDVYSLGCVLYEMLAGTPPFTGPTAQAIIARRLGDPVPSLRTVRDVTEELERVVMKALARAPADRYRDGSSFAAALEAAAASGRSGHRETPWRRLRPVAIIATAGLVALAAVSLILRLHQPRGALDPNLLAIAPFEVLDDSLQLWREGLADVLSRNLDDAGPLRTVPQTVALRRWTGRADRASATALGRRTGAGLVVYGSVVRRAADSVSLRGTVLSVASDLALGDLEVTGAVPRLGELADSLGLAVLQALGRTRPIGAVRHVSLGSRSLPALREFLRGEQLYRRGAWDSALAAYDRAIGRDSAFALAQWRMAQVLGWDPATAGVYQDRQEYRRRALALNRGLSTRDSLVLAADALDDEGRPSERVSDRFQAVALMEAAARRYPQDPEIWYRLGEYLNHDPPPIYRGPGPALEAFDRAITLDSGFTPAYEHVVQLSMKLGRPEQARRYARAYAALGSAAAGDSSLRLAALILDSGGLTPASLAAARAASVQTLFRTGIEHLGAWTDSAETAVTLLREISRGHHEPGVAWFGDTLMWPQYVASALAYRGHLDSAAEADRRLLEHPEASPWSWFLDPFVTLLPFGLIPDSLVRRTFGAALRGDAIWSESSTPRSLSGLPWWRMRGDTVSLRRMQQVAAEVERRAGSPVPRMRGRYLGAAAAASLALARGDSGQAMALFQAIPDSLCTVVPCFDEKMTLARLMASQGRLREAADLLDRWIWAGDDESPAFVLAMLERGLIAERMGDAPKARECYGRVVEVWRTPDPALIPRLEEARKGLERMERK